SYYARIIDKNPDAETVYRYSQMLKANGKYDEAMTYLDKFATMRPSDERAIAFRRAPNYLPAILEEGPKFSLQNLDINSEYSDYGAYRVGDKLYFVSARNTKRRTHWRNAEPYYDLYEADIDEAQTISNAKELEGDINSKFSEGTFAISSDGKTMYFTRINYLDGDFVRDSTDVGISRLNIYRASKIGNGWGNIKPTSVNHPNFSTAHPSISPDGKFLYFSSDKPGGFGESDLYRAPINEDGSLGDAENLGQKVNTPGRDTYPYLDSDGNLYFSSDGHLGLGGLDIFFTKEIDGKFAPVRNVGIPVSSSYDDFSYKFNAETKEGFMASNRDKGKGSDDIYHVKELQPLCDVLINIVVKDEKTGKPIPGASVVLFDTDENQIGSKTADENGLVQYIVECETDLVAKAIMQDYESAEKGIEGTRDEEVNVEIALRPIEEIIVEDEIVLNPIYFEFDKHNITSKAAFELDKAVEVLKKYPELKVSIESHADNRGSDAYNDRLTERRAKATREYLVSRGISEDRLTATGKGEREPAIDCGSNCTEEEHEKNRRSVFKIVE
ncbi:MAG: OmpA family protein, partial [Flavobacteriaceae bacterium]|nr:OmpA family protein [Flavobacteriaceae bacterium]